MGMTLSLIAFFLPGQTHKWQVISQDTLSTRPTTADVTPKGGGWGQQTWPAFDFSLVFQPNEYINKQMFENRTLEVGKIESIAINRR